MTEVRLSRYSWQVIEAYFDVGRQTRFNRHEQLAALGGTYRKGVIAVETALPLLSMNASAGQITISAEQWFAAMQTCGSYGLKLIGSVHSHPLGLGLFLSVPDKETHAQLFPTGVSLVLNPQKRRIAAFNMEGERLILKPRKDENNDKKNNPRNINRLDMRLLADNGGVV